MPTLHSADTLQKYYSKHIRSLSQKIRTLPSIMHLSSWSAASSYREGM